MLNTLKNRFEQGYRTSAYPKTTINLPERYRGRPTVHRTASAELAVKCAEACPQDAIDAAKKVIDLGRCVFCGTCERLSEERFVTFTQDFEIATAQKEDLRREQLSLDEAVSNRYLLQARSNARNQGQSQ